MEVVEREAKLFLMLSDHVGSSQVIRPIYNVQHSEHGREDDPEESLVSWYSLEILDKYLAITSICLAPLPLCIPDPGARTDVTAAPINQSPGTEQLARYQSKTRLESL